MRKLLLFLCLAGLGLATSAQPDTVAAYRKKTYLIPMRDGVKLFTVVLLPVNYAHAVPILMERTPYGVPDAAPKQMVGAFKELTDDG